MDEIVLAGDGETIEYCAAFAHITLQAGLDRSLWPARLRQACGCDWLLCCEDGEVPSRALLQALRSLSREPQLMHLGITHRWLYRDRARYLYSPPWQPDYGPRLVRTDADEAGQSRLVDLPIYRSELLLVPEHERRVRAHSQERLSPEALREGAPAGTILVPEDWDGLLMKTVPEPDRATIASILDMTAPPPPAGDVLANQIDASGPTAAGEATITFVRPVTRMRTGLIREQEVFVRNRGDEPWRWRREGEGPIRLGCRWRTAGAAGEVLEGGPRTPFTETIEPGCGSIACLTIQAPDIAGRYVLEVDVVEEHVRWFGCEARLEVEVEDPRAGRGVQPGHRRAYLAQARAQGLAAKDGLRHHRRWMAGQRSAATPLSDRRPWLTFGAQDALEGTLGPGWRVCEYGSGGSTLFALDCGADLVTIDWDADWTSRVAAVVDAERRGAWTLELVAPEPDAGAARLDPAEPSAYVSASPAFSNFSFRSYARAIERHADSAFDLVLVAGRARPACLRHALAQVASGGLLVLDHSERPWYGPALALAAPAQWSRADYGGPGPYAERFWQTTILRRTP